MYPVIHRLRGVLCLGAILLGALLVLSVGIAPHVVASSPMRPSYTKIDPLLLSLLEESSSAPAIIKMRGSIDLEGLALPEVGLARRQAVVSSLQMLATRTQADLLHYLAIEEGFGRVGRLSSLWIINAVALTGTLDALVDIAARDDVEIVLADQRRQWIAPSLAVHDGSANESIPWNLTQIGADSVWRNLGIDGQGVVVASMDTGVDASHAALRNSYRGYVGDPRGHRGNWFVATGERYPTPGDGHGHGTHTTGIMVGSGPDGVIGVAPGAQWIAVKVLDDQGYGYDSAIHAGFQWLLAPDGDPSLSPQVVNCSWGSSDSARLTFRQDVSALRSAGILPVFAAGNSGADGPGTVSSPASYPESLAVGASDQSDLVFFFSSRGPSPWGDVKPQVVAPGVLVRSTLPGGGYGDGTGTSMAAPHVSGLAALLRQVRPALSPADLEYVITSTARPLGAIVPSNDYGWGRVDAYAAVSSLANAGHLSGVVTGSADLVGATVIAEHADGRRARALVAADGTFSLSLAAGSYVVTASGFAHYSVSHTVVIVPGETTVVHFHLDSMPRTVVSGSVRDAQTDEPLLATVEVLTTPVRVTTDAASGRFVMELPAGHYTLRATSERHRRVSTTVRVAGGASPVDAYLSLPPAPTILLVDSGVWYAEPGAPRLADLLDQMGYLYARYPVQSPLSPPTIEDLLPYDIVIWVAPQDSPGYIHAERAISSYLKAGGRLLLTGQDVAYWDGGGSTLTLATPYFDEFIHAAYVSDNSQITRVVGLADAPLHGLNLTLNHPDSARNQRSPDVVTTTDALPLLAYAADGVAGSLSLTCYPYRVAYLAFGAEGAGPSSTRLEMLHRLLEWLMSPGSAVAATLRIETAMSQVGQPGEVLLFRATVRNVGTLTDTYRLQLSGNSWQAGVWNADFTQALTTPLVLGPCQQRTLGLSVQVPLTATPNLTDRVRLTAQSTLSPTLAPWITLTAKTPSSVLLVDDDRWYDVRAAYEQALGALGYPYDVWDVSVKGSPNLRLLQAYSLVIWFTGYDWFSPLTKQDQETVRVYLERGGRLFVSGQDVLENLDASSSLTATLGIITYTSDVTVTTISGVAGDPIGHGLGPFTLTYPYSNYSDYITPAERASVVFLGNGRAPSAVANRQAVTLTLDGEAIVPGRQVNGRSVFFAFPFEALSPLDALPVMDRLVRWLHPLGDSWMTVSERLTIPGQILTYTIVIRNSSAAAQSFIMSDTIPALTSYIGGSVSGGAVFDAHRNRIVWPASGGYASLQPGGTLTFTFAVRLRDDVTTNGVTTNTVELLDKAGLALRYAQRTEINTADLERSTLSVDKRTAPYGAILTYRLRLHNDGTSGTQVIVTNTIPTSTTLVANSAQASVGSVAETADAVYWRLSLDISTTATLTLSVLLDRPLNNGWPLVNRASIDDGWHMPYLRVVTTTFSAPDVTSSHIESTPPWVLPDLPFRYTYVLKNTGTQPALDIELEDALPPYVVYRGGPITGGGRYDAALGGLFWTGALTPGQTLTLTMEVWPRPDFHGVITNSAVLYDRWRSPHTMRTTTTVPRQWWFLPWIQR